MCRACRGLARKGHGGGVAVYLAGEDKGDLARQLLADGVHDGVRHSRRGCVLPPALQILLRRRPNLIGTNIPFTVMQTR